MISDALNEMDLLKKRAVKYQRSESVVRAAESLLMKMRDSARAGKRIIEIRKKGWLLLLKPTLLFLLMV